ncbi:MAG: DUF3696 domain-containing protein [Subdoligranulum sp.]|nr:DUF3696 domain-containing protein [Subdoligranulum sp.]
MIKEVKISALKSIEHLSVECSKLNILAGANSSGKSTFLQALLLLAQNTADWQGLNGEYVSLGDFRLDAKNYHVTSDKIEIEIITQPRAEIPIKLIFQEEDSERRPLSLMSERIHQSKGEDTVTFLMELYALPNIRYLACSRIGVQDVYPKNYNEKNGVGKNGEYAIFCLQANKNRRLDQSLIYDSSSETLLGQVNYWLHYIIGASISVEDIPGTDMVKASYDIGNERSTRPCNVGSGISYLISIIVMCLLSGQTDTLIIENPEVHLHPKAQSRICDFLYFIASTGRQLFVETHSDHIFNGIRAGIATGDMEKENIIINFFYLDERLCTQNTQINIGKNGRILNYVDGLFDQFDLDLDRMLNINL